MIRILTVMFLAGPKPKKQLWYTIVYYTSKLWYYETLINFVKRWYYGKKLWYYEKKPMNTLPKTMDLWFTMEKTMVLWKKLWY